jgi:hypothetical protein
VLLREQSISYYDQKKDLFFLGGGWIPYLGSRGSDCCQISPPVSSRADPVRLYFLFASVLANKCRKHIVIYDRGPNALFNSIRCLLKPSGLPWQRYTKGLTDEEESLCLMQLKHTESVETGGEGDTSFTSNPVKTGGEGETALNGTPTMDTSE